MRFVVLGFYVVSFVLASSAGHGQNTPTVATIEPEWYCQGDGCDAFLAVFSNEKLYQNKEGQKRLGALLGGLSGAFVGDELAGASGAVALGAIAAIAGYKSSNPVRWEREIKRYNEAWQRGDDMSYNPAHRLPANPHWMQAGPAFVADK